MKKDIFFTIIINFIGLGLGHLYVGLKKRALIILGVQILNLILAGVFMYVASWAPTLFYGIYFIVLGWAMYDSIAEARWINENIEKYGYSRK